MQAKDCILVVDDEPRLVRLVREVMQAVGCRVIAAGDGQAALEMAAIEQPEVIRGILDCLGLNSRAPPLTRAPSPEPTDPELDFEEPWPRHELGDGG